MQVSQILKTKTHGKLFSVYSGSNVNEAVRLLSSERSVQLLYWTKMKLWWVFFQSETPYVRSQHLAQIVWRAG